MDLKITNRGKDYLIEQLQKERNGFALERKEYVTQLMRANRTLGELEARLLYLEGPKREPIGTSSMEGHLSVPENFDDSGPGSQA
jgi:hypothetical protein